MEKLQKTLSEGAWMNNPYAETPLVDDTSNLVVNAIMPALTTPVEGADPDYATPLEMINDAWQADAYGDEGLADAETVQRWEKEREYLLSDTFGADITSGLVRQLGDARSKYTSLYDLMESQRLVSEDKTSLFKVDLKEGATYLNLVANSVLNMNSFMTLADVIQPISILSSLGIALPGSLATPIQEKVAALHQTKTMDTNIPHDNEWNFHTVNFNANGGSVDQKSASTVEDGRLASLPQPSERAGYTFDGWFTAPTGGNLVGAEDDLSGVDMLYAQWTYTGVPEKDTEWSKYSPYRRANAGLDGRTEERTDAGTDRRAISYAREEQDEVARASSTTDLHTRFFGSVEKAHAHIHSTAAEDPAFAAFCEEFASRLTQTANGKYKVDLGSWLLLNADAIQALQACGADVIVTFTCQGLWKIDDQGLFYADPIRRKI